MIPLCGRALGLAAFDSVQLLPALQRAQQCHLIGVLQLAADGDAVGQPRHPHAQRAQQARQIHGRGLALGVRIGGHDDLRHRPAGDAVQQLPDPDVVRPHVVEGRDDTMEHMVHTAVLPCPLHGHHIPRLCDHADGGMVPAVVVTDGAHRQVREILTDRAAVDGRARLDDGVGKGLGPLRRQV